MEVELGKIVGVWGVKGWVKLHSYTRNRGDIANYKTWWLKPAGRKAESSAPQEFQVLSCREQGKGIVAQLAGVTDPDQAQALHGWSIWIEQSQLPKLPAGQYYWQQLIGLQVINKEALNLGTVESVLETGANDVLVLKSPEGTEVLIPYGDPVVENIDLETGTMQVDWDLSYLE
ncbi:MAG: ribosome maturation factor RimM [Pseudomonadota bacterium]